MNKKALFIAIDFVPNVGGIAQYIYGILNQLNSKQIVAIALPNPGWQAFDKQQLFPIHRMKLPQKWNPFHKISRFLGPLFFLSLLKNNKVDVVICCQSHHALMLAAWLFNKVKGTPYWVFIYGNDILVPQTKRLRNYYNYLLKSANRVIAISDKTASLAFEVGVKSEKLSLLPPCIEPKKFLQNDNLPKSLDNLKHEHKSIVLTVGRLVERKGQDMVLKALPSVLRDVPNAHYVIVGSGEDEARLKLLVHELNLSDFVTFVGYVSDEELPAYYAACDLFVMVSREILERGDLEGFGIVYLEANLMGKPVVAGASGGIRDAVVDGETGLLANPENVEEIADAIIRLLKNKELASSMGQRGKKRVLQEFTCDVIGERFSTLLEEM